MTIKRVSFLFTRALNFETLLHLVVVVLELLPPEPVRTLVVDSPAGLAVILDGEPALAGAGVVHACRGEIKERTAPKWM